MSDPATTFAPGSVFAVFRGNLSPERESWHLSRRSVWERCLEFAFFLLLACGLAALILRLGRGQGFADVVKWPLVVFSGGFVPVFAVLHQSSRWLGRRWMQSNELLTGPCEIDLTERHLVETHRTATQRDIEQRADT
jgi:hypothetical protein